MDTRPNNLSNFAGAHLGNSKMWGDVTSSSAKDFKDFIKTAESTPSVIELRMSSYSEDAKRRFEKLEKEIIELKKRLDSIEVEEITIRDIPYNQAKIEVAKYFKYHHGETVDAADIEEALCIEFTMATKICEELENEGKIKVI